MWTQWAIVIGCAVGIETAAHAAPPVPPAPRATLRATVVRALHLTAVQQARIHGIIQTERRNGLPTVATRRDVLRVLTAAQRTSLAGLSPPRTTPL